MCGLKEKSVHDALLEPELELGSRNRGIFYTGAHILLGTQATSITTKERLKHALLYSKFGVNTPKKDEDVFHAAGRSDRKIVVSGDEGIKGGIKEGEWQDTRNPSDRSWSEALQQVAAGYQPTHWRPKLYASWASQDMLGIVVVTLPNGPGTIASTWRMEGPWLIFLVVNWFGAPKSSGVHSGLDHEP